MFCRARASSFASLVALLAIATVGRAEEAQSPGQADLDKAIQLKLGATTVDDLSQVIDLCEGALKKGLDESNATFGKGLLAASLTQRGMVVAQQTMRSLATDGPWQEKRNAALNDLNRALELNPQQPQALYMVARLNLLPEGDAKRASEALDAAIAQSGDEPAMLAEGLLLRSGIQKDLNKRLDDLEAAVKAAPSEPAVYRTRAMVRSEMNNNKAALADIEKALELDPKQAASYQIQAMILMKLRRPDDALAALDKGQTAAPGNADLPAAKARIHALLLDYPAALKELDRALELAPDNVALLLLRAGIHQEKGDKAKALADVEQILKLKPGTPGMMRDRAVLLADLGKLDESMAQLEQLRSASPKDPLTLMQIAMLHAVRKDYAKAVEVYSTLLKDYPDEWLAFRGRGDAMLQLGRRADAIRDYDAALRMRPKDIGILNNLAWVLATAPEENLRDGKRAVVLANEACKLTEFKQDFILSTLAAAHAEAGDFASAEQWINRAIELATKQHIDELKKEQVSYKARKPWREILPEPKAEEKK